MNRLKRVAALAIAVPLLAAPLALASSASADVTTSVRFVETAPAQADFGDAWLVTLVVEYSYPGGPTTRTIGPMGTVDVYVAGISGAFASKLPIQPDGLVYLSQPSDQSLLPPGSHQLSAIFNPDPATGLPTTQTGTSLELTIAGFTAAATLEVEATPSSGPPVIKATISGPYVEKTGGSPAGTWKFTVDSSKGKRAFETEVAQEQGATKPVFVEVTTALASGTEYTVQAEFAPADVLAPGLTVDPAQDVSFRTPDGTVGEALVSSVAVPSWVVIAAAAVLAALAAGVIVASVRMRRGPPTSPSPFADGDETPN